LGELFGGGVRAGSGEPFPVLAFSLVGGQPATDTLTVVQETVGGAAAAAAIRG
jgi:hypothetical protein